MDTLELKQQAPSLRSIGWTNVWWSDGALVQRRLARRGGANKRLEPAKLYATEELARKYATPGFRPAEVFVEDRIRDAG